MAILQRMILRNNASTTWAQLCFQRRTMASLLKGSKAYVNGQWVEASTGKTFEVKNPVDGKVIASVPDMSAGDTKVAIDAASKAFASWKETTVRERSILLRKWFTLCEEHKEDLAKLLTSEQGKPLAEARGEIGYSNGFLEWFAEEARRIYGEVVPAPTKGKEMVLIRQPVGVAALITPWNFPAAMITRKAGAALASGCTIVVKPAEDTPLTALALANLAEQAGFPKGVINVVTCQHGNASDVGKAMCDSPDVGVMSFTGSSRVGKILYRQCAGTVKKLALELGGDAPFIVFNSADLDKAVEGMMVAKFRNMGQTCVSANRVFVQEEIHDAFIEKLKSKIEKALVLGDGMDPAVNQGPLINQPQFTKVCSLVDDAKGKGAGVALGGTKCEARGGLYYLPTILTDVNSTMDIFREEIFGPVVSIIKFKHEEEAVNMANECRVGLAGYFYSNDVGQCWRVGKKLEVGMVGINEGLISAPEAAFGGVKESGLGREGSHHGIDEYTDWKYLCFGGMQ